MDDNLTQGGISSVSSPKPGSPSLPAPGLVANQSGPGSSLHISSGKWWPDYNPQWNQGKCVNDGTTPSGRPSYDSGEECCLASYGGQSSNVCIDAISDFAESPTLKPTNQQFTPSPTDQPTTTAPATPNPTNQATALPTAQQGASTAIPTAKQEAETVNKPEPLPKPESTETPDSETIAAPSNIFTATDASNSDREEINSPSSLLASTSTPSRPPVDLPSGASDTLFEFLKALESHKDEIDSKLFVYNDPSRGWVKSNVYHFTDFHAGLISMATKGVANKRLYIGGENVENGHVYGLVNVAAFIAQSMKETIQYDACDENSWDMVNGKYPLSNACGQ